MMQTLHCIILLSYSVLISDIVTFLNNAQMVFSVLEFSKRAEGWVRRISDQWWHAGVGSENSYYCSDVLFEWTQKEVSLGTCKWQVLKDCRVKLLKIWKRYLHVLSKMALRKRSERLKESTLVGVLFQKRYPVTLLKWDSTTDIVTGMPQLFFLQDIS